jgi:hypothetical protein
VDDWRPALSLTAHDTHNICTCVSLSLRGNLLWGRVGGRCVTQDHPLSSKRDPVHHAMQKSSLLLCVCGCVASRSPFPLRQSRISPFICAGFLGIIIIVCAHRVSTLSALTHSLPLCILMLICDKGDLKLTRFGKRFFNQRQLAILYLHTWS